MLTWPHLERLVASWSCSLPPSSISPFQDMPRSLAPSYNYHHYSLLFTTLSCPTHHFRRKNKSTSSLLFGFLEAPLILSCPNPNC
jgi:hypothetical protein